MQTPKGIEIGWIKVGDKYLARVNIAGHGVTDIETKSQREAETTVTLLEGIVSNVADYMTEPLQWAMRRRK